MSETSTVELRIAARPENVALARLALVGVASVAGASREETADLKLAVSEICTNAVVHAYAGMQEDGRVVLRYSVGDGVVTVEIEDAGGGFDALIEPEPVSSPRDGTLGLSIARSVSDDFLIESGDGGTRVVFSKHLSRS
jgi:serine/threonine-protein kinase RsbW